MIPIPFDYEILRLLWWGLLGILLIGFAVMGGYDMGVAFLNPLLGRTDLERRQVINAMAPFWDGNQVWLLLGGGAVFAAFPAIYATAFSGFYLAMLLTLLALILRPVALEYRQKFSHPRHRAAWDYALMASGIVPPLVFGVAFGNLFLGVPYYLDDIQMPHYVDSFLGSFFHLLKPFALLTGVLSVVMLATHGAVFLAARTEGRLRTRASLVAFAGLGVWIALFAAGGIWVGQLDGYTITSAINPLGPSDPTLKTVAVQPGVWLRNYEAFPVLYAVPLLGMVAAAVCSLLLARGRAAWAFAASGTMVACTVATAGIALFPFLMTSSHTPAHSFTVYDSTSSHLTLWLMTIAAVTFVPLVLAYTAWAFHKLRGVIKGAEINEGKQLFY